MKPWVAKLKALGIGAVAVLFVIVGIRQCFYEAVSLVGDVGMDDLGRQVFCQTLDRELRESGDISVRCEGFHKQILVICMKNAAPIIFGRIKPHDTMKQMTKPYSEALEGISGLVLRGDKLRNTLDKPTPIAEVDARLRKLGVKTVGDFYAAAGFEKFLIRDEEQNTSYLELTFSNKQYGRNPVSMR
jgi:hypothetical protein